MTDILKAIVAIDPNAKVSVNAEDLDQITWHDGTAEISKADIQAKIAELQTEYDAQGYVRSRIEEYGSPEKQIEFITENSLKEWKEKVAEIKAKYPKG